MSKVKTIYIGKKDIYSWKIDEGKSIMMPILFEFSKKLIEKDLDELKCLRVEAIIRGETRPLIFLSNEMKFQILFPRY